LHTHSIFREFKLPVARKAGSLPVFFDFSQVNFPENLLSPQFIDEVVVSASGKIDGVILSPGRLPGADSWFGKEFWVRADSDAAYLPAPCAEKRRGSSLGKMRDWVQNGASGILGTLVLGNSAPLEADNIQNLFTLRTKSLDVGLPLAIDVHVIQSAVRGALFSDIVDLGLNLAVEIGCDLALLPGAGILASDENIRKIAAIPVLARLSIKELLSEDQSLEAKKSFLQKLDGVVFTDLQDWDQLIQLSQFSQLWDSTLQFQPVGE